MKRYVEIEPVCPFLGGKPCIKDGWQFNGSVYHPCAFFDGDSVYHGVSPEEPCRIKRAIRRILSDEVSDETDPDYKVDVPWTSEKE